MNNTYMNDPDTALLRREWLDLQKHLAPAPRLELAEVVRIKAPLLVKQFYDVLASDPDANEFFSQDLIRDRLGHALVGWLNDLFPAGNPPDFDDMVTKQLRVGAVHARIALPLKLVNRGLRLMNEGLLTALLQDAKEETRVDLICTASSTLSIAIDIMNMAYNQENRKSERSAEAFRMHALGRNLSQEREAQRAALAEWMQEVLLGLASGALTQDLTALHHAEFGRWLSHRGAVIFEGMPELDRVQDLVRLIDTQLIPNIRAHKADPIQLANLTHRTTEIKALMANCFNAAARVEGAHDPLTGTLNRRFMETILAREVAMARKKRQNFSIAIIDMDHFKSINDRFGHAGGDVALQQCAEIISSSVRAGDFVFRYGGEEFLIALVETSLEAAHRFCEGLRATLSAHDIVLPHGETINLTASIGVAECRGELDFNRLIVTADEALYRAKNSGRNRVCVAA